MSWANTILSTPESIANILNLINSMAGSTTVPGITFNGTASIDFALSQALSIKLYYSDGSYLLAITSPHKYTPTNGKQITSILILTTTDGVYDNTTLPLMLQYGLLLHDTSSNVLAVLSDTTLWTTYLISKGWYNKIAIAKSRIAIHIRNLLINMGYNLIIVNSLGYQLLDVVTNPLLFSQASDNLVMALIYKDMSSGGTDLNYWNKYNAYMSLYRLFRDLALRTCKFDPYFTGTASSNMKYNPRIYV